MYKISIVVPVYNTAEYLPKCLDSLIHQTYQNIEIICVNDGSTDNSLKVLREYEENSNKIKVISQTNGSIAELERENILVQTKEYRSLQC